MRRPSRLTVAVLLLGALIAAACAETTDEERAAIAAVASSGFGDGPSTLPRPNRPPAAATPAGREGAPPSIEPTTCPFERDDLAPVECGTIELPGRGADESYTVEIAYARFFATGGAEDIRPDPVVYLHGGPGGAILDDGDFWYDSIVEPHIRSRDVILYDQRGGGRSTDLPACHEASDVSERFYGEVAAHDTLAAEYVAALDACATKFRELTTVDLTAFNSAANAQDLVDLMWALGVSVYNLHGSSYGTRLAQTIMRDAPEGVRSIVLSGVYPIEENLMGSVAGSMESSLNAVFAGCAAQPGCADVLPDPWSTLEDLVDELDADPLPVEIPTTYDDSDTIMFDGTDLLNGLHNLLYVGRDAASVPDLLIDYLDGDNRRIRRLAGESIFDLVDTATFLLVQCADEGPFTTSADLDRPLTHDFLRAIDLAPAINGIDSISICESWDTGVTDPIENEPVTWDVPTLILSGAVDPITPPAWAADLAARLPRSRLAVQATASHDSDEGWCALGLIADFIEQPDVLLDTSCTANDADLPIDERANRLRAPLEAVDWSLDLDGDGQYADIRLPDWTGEWRADDVYIRWRALDPFDPTALIVLDGDSDYDLVDHLRFSGLIPDWDAVPRPFVPRGWTRWTMETTGGDLISYVRDTDQFEIVLVREPGEPDDLEREVLLPAAISAGDGR
jgi:pimeloyl-ACP methyl ester carboxylesterase